MLTYSIANIHKCCSIWCIIKYSSATNNVFKFLIVYTVNHPNFFDFGVTVGDAQMYGFYFGKSPPTNLSTPIQFYGTAQHTLFVSQLHIHHLCTGTIHDNGWHWVLHIYTGDNNTVTNFCSSWHKCLWSYDNNSYCIASFGSQINTNGFISFNSPTWYLSHRTLLLSDVPVIVPFWARYTNFENVFYRRTNDTTLLQRARDQLQELFPSSGNFTPTTLFIATWENVARFGRPSQVSAYMWTFLLVTITTHCNFKCKLYVNAGSAWVCVEFFSP